MSNDESRTYGFSSCRFSSCSPGSGRSSMRCTAELARRGHPDIRPAHGFALQAIGFAGATATETGRRLGISKQAAGKTIDRLEELGYVHRVGDDADRRRKLARVTPRGIEALAMSAMIFNDIRSRWEDTLGAARLADMEAGLGTMVPGETFRLDVPGWFGAEMSDS